MQELFEDKKDDGGDKEKVVTNVSGLLVVWGILVIVWFFAGLAGFVASLVCLAFYGSATSKALGVIIALLFGPFYWLYFIFNSKYCTRNPVDEF